MGLAFAIALVYFFGAVNRPIFDALLFALGLAGGYVWGELMWGLLGRRLGARDQESEALRD